jgi:hypothetical protein
MKETDMTDTTRDNDSGAREQAQEKAQEVAGEAKNRVREQVDQRSTDAGHRVQTTAGDIRGVGEELRKQGKDKPAKMAEEVADRVERVGGYLERSDGDTILHDVEDFGRRQPWAVVLGGVALGIVASRLLKASSEGRYEQSRRSVSGNLGDGAWSSDRDLAQTGGTPQTAGTPQMAGI